LEAQELVAEEDSEAELEAVIEAVASLEHSVLQVQAVTEVVAVEVEDILGQLLGGSGLVEEVSDPVKEISEVVPKVDTVVVVAPGDSEMVPAVVSVLVPEVDHLVQWYQS
jgi:hypothetical protein